MEKTGMGLEQLKIEYLVLHKKYDLPSFKEMNEDFYIEKIAENETEMLMREVRRMVGDRLANYMRFIENLLNPVNVPMFVFSIIKLIGADEKKKLQEIYKKLIKNEIKFVERDLEFDEAKEAEFIKGSYGLWQEMKKEISGVFEMVDKNWETKTEENSKGYFG
ncbi:MAG: hypothetical protein U1B79_00470 [Candidatus Pacearchaeota archaeon]|nr:hypothetical protein [Nanoarchaeota archaeon]MDZ4226568.1 hypothetical protein [Candidatus Pacearchaeota archaeon]